MVVSYCYLEIKNDKICKFHLNSYSYFQISAYLFQAPEFKASRLNKRRRLLLEEIWYIYTYINIYIYIYIYVQHIYIYIYIYIYICIYIYKYKINI